MSKKEEQAYEYSKRVSRGNPMTKDLAECSFMVGWDEAVKERLQDNESKIIELDTILEYKDGEVFIKKMNTNEMPVTLTFALIDALNNTIVEYYKKEKQ